MAKRVCRTCGVSVQKLKGEEVDGNEVQMRLYFPTPLAKGKGAKPRFVPGSSLPHLRSCRLTIRAGQGCRTRVL
jgi:hypothetical protein